MGKILQLKIYLNGIKPQIWRRFLVKDEISFHKLHNIIQEVMGWEDYHLYEFNLNGESIGLVDDDALDSNPELKDSEKIKLLKYLNEEKQKFLYIYDFGDSWEHILVVEKILEGDASKKYPVCIEGERACPPEDCGGIWGYEEFLKIKNNKNHPDYEEKIVDWLGEDFDFEKFDLEGVNKNLQKF